MPCWTVQTSTLNLTNADPDLLEAALVKLGFTNIHRNDAYAENVGAVLTADRFSDSVSVKVTRDGRVQATLSGSARAAGVSIEKLGSEVSRAYSREVVVSTAKRFGWTLKQTGEDEFQVMRRGM